MEVTSEVDMKNVGLESNAVQAKQAAFTGFSRDHIAFFRELARNNRKEWFDQKPEALRVAGGHLSGTIGPAGTRRA